MAKIYEKPRLSTLPFELGAFGNYGNGGDGGDPLQPEVHGLRVE